MRAALLSMRSASSVLPVHSRSSAHARAPSRLVSTEAAVKPAKLTPVAKHIEKFVPTASILTFVISVASIAAYFNGEMQKLKADLVGITKEVDAKIVGVVKEVDAKNTGSEKAVQERVAGSEKAVAKEIAGFKEAADLKVRFLLRARLHARSSLSHFPASLSPLAVQDQVTGSSPSPSPSPSSSSRALH
jgi:hypothetical protein